MGRNLDNFIRSETSESVEVPLGTRGVHLAIRLPVFYSSWSM